MNIDQPLVSIIIPTYNEKDDVRISLDASVRMAYPHKEIIVVDDSTDETPEIIREYEKHGIRLIHRHSPDNGCCGARNEGILQAKGEIVILLNADVFPDSDFIDRILVHYNNGADYVLVRSEVANKDFLFPRFIEAEGRYLYDGQDNRQWSESFSCRRQAAIDVGLLPGDYPMRFCRDWLLGKNLGENNYKRVIDDTITVKHIAPHTFKDYCRVKKTRGRISILFKYYIQKKSLPELFLVALVKSLMTCCEIVTVVPFIYRCSKMATFSPRNRKDVMPFVWSYLIERVAFNVGEWAGGVALLKDGK